MGYSGEATSVGDPRGPKGQERGPGRESRRPRPGSLPPLSAPLGTTTLTAQWGGAHGCGGWPRECNEFRNLPFFCFQISQGSHPPPVHGNQVSRISRASANLPIAAAVLRQLVGRTIGGRSTCGQKPAAQLTETGPSRACGEASRLRDGWKAIPR